jgi:RNA polymerase sigma-70 factor (ECF subfamily)
MAEGASFAELMRRIRAGEAEAAGEPIRRYEPAIRREARFRLGRALRPQLDSMDICQSVLGSFFVRVVAGHYELETPGHLIRLLIAMTRNKVRAQARRRREARLGGHEPIADAGDPSGPVVSRDLVEAFRRRLSEKELGLWERRRRDLFWPNSQPVSLPCPELLR